MGSTVSQVIPTESTSPWKPQRYLDPYLAGAVAAAKARTGLTWREVARLTGISHGYLILIAQGKRVPSNLTVEAIADVLTIDPDALELLRQVAVPKRHYPV